MRHSVTKLCEAIRGTHSRHGSFVEVQHPAEARPAINALGLRVPDACRRDQLVIEILMIAFESGVLGAALRTAAEVGGGGSGESHADHSEVRGGTDPSERSPEPLIGDGMAGARNCNSRGLCEEKAPQSPCECSCLSKDPLSARSRPHTSAIKPLRTRIQWFSSFSSVPSKCATSVKFAILWSRIRKNPAM
jgi:hypothetical protein